MTDVDHREVLKAFALLDGLPARHIIGRREMARKSGLIFTVELSTTAFQGAYDGFWLTVLTPAVGVIDRVRLTFAEHGADRAERTLDHYNAEGHLKSVASRRDLPELHAAVRNYITIFAGATD